MNTNTDPAIIERRARLREIANRVCEKHGIGTTTTSKEQPSMNPIRTTSTTADTDGWITLTLPPVFFEDHYARDLVKTSGTRDEFTVKQAKKKITVRLTVADALELLSDAEHYADSGMAAEVGWHMQYLISSARATVLAINKQWPKQA